MTDAAAPHCAGRRVHRGRDPSLLIAGQAVRAAGYGFTAVLLGALLGARGYGHLRAGVVLTALIAGTSLSSASVVAGSRCRRLLLWTTMTCVFALPALFAAVPGLARCGCCGGVYPWRGVRRPAATPGVVICRDCGRSAAARLVGRRR